MRASSRGEEAAPTRQIVESIIAISRQLMREAQAAGVIIIIDELGKFWEHAAANSDNCALFLLQQLAEATTRSADNRERRNQLVHPVYQKPELLASAPNQLWSWDISKLLAPK